MVMADDAEDEFELLMPLVVVRSKGGPFDDEAYTAGFEAGRLWELLGAGVEFESRAVRTANIRQLDLIAMHFGYALTTNGPMEVEGAPGSEWTEVQLTQWRGDDGVLEDSDG